MDNTITFRTDLDNSQLEKEYTKTVKKIEDMERDISAKKARKSSLEVSMESLNTKIEATKQKLYDMQLAPKGTFSTEEIKAQGAELAALMDQWDTAQDEVAKYDKQINSATEKLEVQKIKAVELAGTLNQTYSSSGKAMQEAFDKVESSAEKFGHRLKNLAARAMIFNVISSGLRAVISYMGDALQCNDEYSAQLAKLKGALLTAFQPIYEYVLPGLTAVLRVLTAIVQVAANVLSALFGKSTSQSAKNAESLYNEANAIESVGTAAKKAQKDLAGFDEINRLDSNEDTGSSGASVGTGTTPDFSDFDTAEYKAKIDELTVYLSGALLALGAILAFSGANIPLGIALMAAGAIGLVAVIKENWGTMSDELQSAISNVTLVLGTAALVIGAILAFSGVDVPKGIALMAIGAAAMAATVAVNWDSISKDLDGAIAVVELLLGSAVLALGAVLAFSGANLPLGIAMMALGAYAIYESATLNWESLSRALEGPLGKITAAVSIALLAIGAVLAFSGANLPLGIALIAAGAAGLVTVAAVNWSTIETALQGPVGKVTAIVSGALIVLGAILAFSGVNIPLGIALISAGAAGLVTVTAVNWNVILEKLQGAWGSIKQWFNTAVKPKLTLDYWKEKFSNIGGGLKQAFKNGANGAITVLNNFIDFLNDTLSFDIPAITIAGQKIFSGKTLTLAHLDHIPKLAQGAVIPPNREFLAVLGDQKHGTNIEAPLETIQEAVALVMEDMTGGMMAGFEATVAVLKEILEAIYGIEIGDEVIAKAVERYNRKMAVVKGGT